MEVSATARTGYMSEQAAIAELLQRGHHVAIPVIDEGVDLVVDYRVTVQVKASALSKTGNYCFNLNRMTPVDLYILHGYATNAWWILTWAQVCEAGGSGAISISENPTRDSKNSHLAWECRDAWDLFKTPDSFSLHENWEPISP